MVSQFIFKSLRNKQFHCYLCDSRRGRKGCANSCQDHHLTICVLLCISRVQKQWFCQQGADQFCQLKALMQDQDGQGIEKPHSASGSGGPASAGTPGPLSGELWGLEMIMATQTHGVLCFRSCSCFLSVTSPSCASSPSKYLKPNFLFQISLCLKCPEWFLFLLKPDRYEGKLLSYFYKAHSN